MVASISTNGYIDSDGEFTNFIKNIRPILIIPELEDLNLEKYKDSLEVFGIEWIYIGDEMVLAEKPIFESIFDLNSNNYETSVIKLKLENWLNR